MLRPEPGAHELGVPVHARAENGGERIAEDVVRYAGEIVAVVLTEDRLQGPDAAELVVVDLDDLPAVPDPQAGLRGESLLFPEAGTNVCAEFPAEEPDDHLDPAALSPLTRTYLKEAFRAVASVQKRVAGELGVGAR